MSVAPVAFRGVVAGSCAARLQLPQLRSGRREARSARPPTSARGCRASPSNLLRRARTADRPPVELQILLPLGLPSRQINVLRVFGEPGAAPERQLRCAAGPVEIVVQAKMTGLGVISSARLSFLGEQLSAEEDIVPPQAELVPGVERQTLRRMAMSWTW